MTFHSLFLLQGMSCEKYINPSTKDTKSVIPQLGVQRNRPQSSLQGTLLLQFNVDLLRVPNCNVQIFLTFSHFKIVVNKQDKLTYNIGLTLCKVLPVGKRNWKNQGAIILGIVCSIK